MPCTGQERSSPQPWDFNASDATEALKRVKKIEAMLCGICTVLDAAGDLTAILDQFDEREAGVGVADLKRWWKQHKVEDEQRRRREGKS